ncbi:MAG: alpha/beta hydrolase [Pseudomonadota bacterium]|nr:alpha/beta hydrolase [Pseudomonadota bacterium]
MAVVKKHSDADAAVVSGHINVPDGFRLAVDLAGNPWQHRVLFLHGGGQSRRSWHRAIRNMVGNGFSVLSYDLRGHGDSDWAPDGDYSLDAHVRDLTAIIESLPSRPSIVGAAFGGRVALEATAALGPDLVRNLVLVDLAPRLDPAGIERVRSFFRVSRDGFDSIEQAGAALDQYAERSMTRNFFKLRGLLRIGPDQRFYWRWDPRVGSDGFFTPPDLEARLSESAARLAVPTLLVRGTDSDLVTDQSVAHFRECQPAAEVVSIPGSGHLMKAQDLNVYCAATLAFLKANTGR